MWHSGQSERVFKQTAQTIISCPLISFMFSVQPSFLSLFILLSSLPPSLFAASSGFYPCLKPLLLVY